MGVFTNIEAALNTRLATLSPSMPIAWPNIHYTPVENTAFIRPTLLPISTDLNTFSGSEKHIGIYQIDIFVPLEKGISALDTLLDSIQDLFKSNKVITATDVVWVQAVGRGRAQRQESWYVSFVEINYLCHS
jgi:hypothetical protein